MLFRRHLGEIWQPCPRRYLDRDDGLYYVGAYQLEHVAYGGKQ